MPYTVKMTIFDLGGFYTAGLPALAGVLTEGAAMAPVIGTSTPGSLTMTFPTASDPPGVPGTLHDTDPAGPGDFFRSGSLATWPPDPAMLNVGTGIQGIPWATITVPLPIATGIPAGIAAAVGVATGSLFIPFALTITRLGFSASPTAGAIRVSFTGTIGYVTVFVPRRTGITGTVDVTLTPSGNVLSPGTFFNVTTSNLSITPGFITPLSTIALAVLAPAFGGALAGPLSTMINSAVSTRVAALRMSLPLTPSGQPLFSSAATVSIRRVSVAPSGLVVQAVLGELTADTVPGTPSGSSPGTGQKPQLQVAIEPQPEEGVANTYMMSVRNAADGSPVQDANVTITTFTAVIGSAVTVSAQTDAQGLAHIEVTLRSRYRPGSDPTNTGQLERTPPRLVVTKQGFEDYLLQL